MNTTPTPQAPQTAWEDFVFTQPLLPLPLRAEFFTTAPEGTLVEVAGDLYQLNSAGVWSALGEVVNEENFGSPYATHATYDPSYLATAASSQTATVRVLRLG